MVTHIESSAVDAVRHFNRFYTRQVGLLDEGLLRSEFSLTESRILYELSRRRGATASALLSELQLDAGYLSRIVKKFEARGLVERRVSTSDARQSLLDLTAAGRSAFKGLNQASKRQVSALLARLHSGAAPQLLQAMLTIEGLLSSPTEGAAAYSLRGHRVGDLGWIAHRQGLLYAQEHGWDATYEALVAEILAQFVRTFDARFESSWIAERGGQTVGSVFVVRESDDVARLRLLYVEPSERGRGLGRRLVDECIAFARARGYATLTLWTNDVLGAARRIYQATGFQLVKEEPHHSFGHDLVGQTWCLAL